MNRCCFFIGVTLNDNPVAYHFSALAHQLVTRGHQVVLLTPHRKVELENPDGNPAIYTWPSERPTHLLDARFLWRLVRRYKPCCFVANFAAVNVMTVIGCLARVPIRVAWYHSPSAAQGADGSSRLGVRGLLRFRKRLVYGLLTHVAAVSKSASADIQTAFKVPGRKCRVLYNSLPETGLHSSLTTAEDQEAGPTLVCAGRLLTIKGQDVLIRALAIMNEPELEVSVEFIGEGPQETAFRQLAQQLGVERQCAFVGKVPHGEVLKRMARARATVVPSRSEAFGLVNIESMSVGTPVVASDVGGIPEVVRNGIDGFLVPPDNPEALASKLKLLLTDARLRQKLGANARERFLSTFEQNRVVEEQADWLESIARMSHGSKES